jgi:uncharacterized protein (TIGR00369 family)
MVRLRFMPRSEHIGFAQTVHGGIVATLLDEIMVWACAVQTRRFAFCAELNVRYLLPVRLNEPTVAVGELTVNRRRLYEAKAELRTESGTVLATATGKYLPIKDRDVPELTSDFVGNPNWAVELQPQKL